MTATLEAYLGRRSAARVLAAPLRRDIGETIQAALLYADLRGFTTLSDNNPPAVVIAALNTWFDRIAGAVHAFGGEVLKFIGDGVLAIFPVVGGRPRSACDAALRAVSAARVGMAHLDEQRLRQGLPALPFGAALHLGEILWGNIGAADRLDFTAIGPAVNLVNRLEDVGRHPDGRPQLPPRGVAPRRPARRRVQATPHTLRHSLASLLFERGHTAVQIAAWLGHSDPSFTLRTYVHARDVGDAEFLDDVFGG